MNFWVTITNNLHHNSWQLIYFGVKSRRSRSRGTKKHCRRGFLHSCQCWLLLVLILFSLYNLYLLFVTGPPNGPVLFCSLVSVVGRMSSSVVVCNAAGRRKGRPPDAWAVGWPTLYGEPVRLRPVRATLCYVILPCWVLL